MSYSVRDIAAIIADPRAGDRMFAIEAQPGQRSQTADLLASLLPGSERIMLDANTVERASLPCTTVIEYDVDSWSGNQARDLMCAIYEGRVPNTVIVFNLSAPKGNKDIPLPLIILSRMVWLEAEAAYRNGYE